MFFKYLEDRGLASAISSLFRAGLLLQLSWGRMWEMQGVFQSRNEMFCH